jgi:lipopolysaccharide heptosyltransferase II
VNILLSRLRLIGDVVFTTPLLRGLRHHFPDAHIAYLVEPPAASIVRGNPHIDELIEIPLTRGLARLASDIAIARQLRRRRFDIALDLHGGPRSAWLVRASGAPMRIGYTIKGRSWMYTHVVQRAPDLTPRHSVRNQWDLLQPLGIGPADEARYPMEMIDDPQAAARVDARLDAAGIAGHPIAIVHVSAGNPFRRWPEESFRALVVQLARRDPSRRIVLTSGPSDAAAARRIADAARTELGALAAAVPDMGELDLPELRALTARAAVYIGGDSGPVHVAATTTTPIVELLGPTLPERSRPWRDPRWFADIVDAGALPCRPCHQRVCEPGDFRCLTSITPERVAAAAERAIDSHLSREQAGNVVAAADGPSRAEWPPAAGHQGPVSARPRATGHQPPAREAHA